MNVFEKEVAAWIAKGYDAMRAEIARLTYDHSWGSPVWQLPIWAAWADATGQSRHSPCMN